MSKRMLINASHEEESRVAIVDGDYLQELDIESAQKIQTKSNIYKGTITKIEPSLQAAFVEYGSARQGFLSLNEIHPEYWKEGADKTADHRNVSIQDVLEHKQPILVQVVKEERGTKGAALTTYISLAGRYLVLSPNTERGGISRKLDEADRQAMKQILAQLNVPENMGLILRTAGKDQTLEALQRDYAYLSRLWDEIRIKSQNAPLPSLIYLEGDLATRAIRDHFTDDIAEIWVDNYDIYERTKQFVHAVLPGKEKLVKLYRGKKPLFRHYKVEDQCEEIHEREIRLPSGGSIVFDPTEALTSIDVNSSRSTGGKHIDDTAVATNLEAAREIARQLRIRDIGGLVVIDFIDMASRKHAQQVEETLRDACKGDKARIQMARISRFGLLEMSRQRLHPSVRESTTEMCPRCQGRGYVLTTESMALHVLTRIEDLAEAGNKPTLVVQVPSDTGEYLMNNKRADVARIESLYEIQVTLQIRQELEIPHYRIERHWSDDNQQKIEVLEDTTKGKKPPRPGRKLKPLEPIVGVPQAPEEPEVKPKASLIGSLFGKLLGRKDKEEEAVAAAAAAAAEEEEKKAQSTAGQGARRGRRGGRNRRGGRKPQQAGTAQAGQEQGERRKPKHERPERPAEAKPDDGENGADGDVQKKRRRRRRRRPSGRSGEQSTSQSQTAGGEARPADNQPAVPVGK
jgi:ribonuclease E